MINPTRRLLLDPKPSVADLSHLPVALTIFLGCTILPAIACLFIISLRNCLRSRHQDQQPNSNHSAAADSEQKDEVDIILSRLESIPVHVQGDSSSSDESCSICLAEYKVGEEVRAMPKCGHAFHKECVDRWLLTRSSFCPTCRDQVVERAVEQARTNCRNGNGQEAAAAGAVRFHFLQMSTQQFRGLL